MPWLKMRREGEGGEEGLGAGLGGWELEVGEVAQSL